MATSYFKNYFRPDTCARILNYTKDALILWASCVDIGLQFLKRGYKYDQLIIDEALKNPDKVCLLNVDSGGHWVLGIYRVAGTSTFWVVDPWTGSRKFYRGVVGYATLTKD
jgi:hypothetical protein